MKGLSRQPAARRDQDIAVFAKDPAMASFSKFAPHRRSIAVTALIGAIMLAAPLIPARAQTPVKATEPTGKATPRAETIEQRITALHAALKITPAQEADWQAVAKTMRDNAATLQKLAADKAAESQKGVTAVEELQAYARIAQAHVDGLNSMIASFQTLYTSMPDQQKKLADEVFRNSHRRQAASLR
jgi:periplasmic protein CpxP/Spy